MFNYQICTKSLLWRQMFSEIVTWDSQAVMTPNIYRKYQCIYKDTDMQRQMDPLPVHLTLANMDRVIYFEGKCSMKLSLETHRQLDPHPLWVTLYREQSDIFTVQCCHWDSQADWTPNAFETSNMYKIICFKANAQKIITLKCMWQHICAKPLLWRQMLRKSLLVKCIWHDICAKSLLWRQMLRKSLLENAFDTKHVQNHYFEGKC